MRDAKVQMRVFAENILTGDVADGVADDVASVGEKGESEDGGEKDEEDFSAALNQVSHDLRV